LNFFEYWHNNKLDNRHQAVHLNDVEEKHGESRSQSEHLLQWHSTTALQKGLLGLYAETRIQQGVKLLEGLGFISIHKNPNPKLKWDHTNYYLFHPETIIAWLKKHRDIETPHEPETPVNTDAVFLRHREPTNTASVITEVNPINEAQTLVPQDAVEIRHRSRINTYKNTATITEITEKEDPPVSTKNVETSPKGTKGTRLPKDWRPTEADIDWAHTKGFDQLIDLTEETEGFCGYWWSRVKDATKLDWSLTWQNRIRDQAKYAKDKQLRLTHTKSSPSPPISSSKPRCAIDGCPNPPHGSFCTYHGDPRDA